MKRNFHFAIKAEYLNWRESKNTRRNLSFSLLIEIKDCFTQLAAGTAGLLKWRCSPKRVSHLELDSLKTLFFKSCCGLNCSRRVTRGGPALPPGPCWPRPSAQARCCRGAAAEASLCRARAASPGASEAGGGRLRWAGTWPACRGAAGGPSAGGGGYLQGA